MAAHGMAIYPSTVTEADAFTNDTHKCVVVKHISALWYLHCIVCVRESKLLCESHRGLFKCPGARLCAAQTPCVVSHDVVCASRFNQVLPAVVVERKTMLTYVYVHNIISVEQLPIPVIMSWGVLPQMNSEGFLACFLLGIV